MNLNAAALFVKVTQYGSFSETARRTNVPVATVSRHIKALEKELGVRLLERSTRRLRLTDSGKRFLDHARQGVEAFETGLCALEQDQLQLSGTLRLSLPPGFVPWRSLLRDFQTQHPNVAVEVLMTERRVDLIEDGIDVALRIGDRQDKGAIVKKLGEYRHLLVASPAFLNAHHEPQRPKQLAELPCASWRNAAGAKIWLLGSEATKINPFLQVNDYLHLLELALAGLCITELPPFLAQAPIVDGRLKRLLIDYPLPLCELNLLYPSQKQLSRLVRTYIDFCAERGANLV
ncbi:MAG: LysR family transcriptional regulator [Elainellaceae cyanobacterium]